MSFTPAALDPRNPQLLVVADGIGFPGPAALMGASPAPFTLSLPSGVPFPVTATFQALIADASAIYGLSITNAVAIIVGP